MRLIDGLKLKGRPAEIPDCSRDDLPQFFVEMGFKVGAEIGVDKGEFSEKFCQAGLKMYAIDPWRGRPHSYREAQKNLALYQNCTIIRKTSMAAVQNFESRTLDFVYIDGDHRFPYIAEDIYSWYWKIKKGGAISGHDYSYTAPNAKYICQPGVVVKAFVEAFGIPSFYIFGRTKHIDQEAKDDKYLSWLFFKK